MIKSLKFLKDFELFIRVHPISDKRKSLYDQIKWNKFHNGKNIHVVPHDSPINSYELLDTANLVVTYGGNIALEAVYWGKNVITLRNAIFSKEKFIFEPKTFKELLNYIINLKFLKNPINRSKVLPYAYYFMVFGRKFKYFKCKSFDECYYKNIPVSHLNLWMRKIKIIKIIYKKNMRILNIFKELDRKFRRRTIILIILMFFAGLLEMIGISLILPLLSLLTGTLDTKSTFLNYINSLIGSINLDNDKLILFFIVFISLLYIIKNLYLAFIYFLQGKFIRDFQIKLGKKLLNAYLSMPVNQLSNKNSSIYIRNLSNDLVFLANSLTCYATLFLEGSIIFLIILMLFITLPLFTLIIIFVFAFVTGLYVYLSNKKIKNWGENRQFFESEKIKNLKQSIEFIREIKIYNISNFS